MSGSRPLYLVGPMGVGKSTIGPLLAERLGRAYIDTDREIEIRASQTIEEIFETQGEPEFRRLEREAIDATEGAHAVVALGGGAIVQKGACARLQSLGDLVYLSARAEVLLKRIGDATTRPLLAGLDGEARLERIRALIDERRAFYEEARIQVDTEGEAQDVVDRIASLLGDSEGAGERI